MLFCSYRDQRDSLSGLRGRTGWVQGMSLYTGKEGWGSHTSGVFPCRDTWSWSCFQTCVCNFLFGLCWFWEMVHFLICLLKGFHTFGYQHLISFDDNHSSTILTSRLLSSVTLSSHPSLRLKKFTCAFDFFSFYEDRKSVIYLLPPKKTPNPQKHPSPKKNPKPLTFLTA